MSNHKSSTDDQFNSKEFARWNDAQRLAARRNRNFDRAVLIVARLNFEGVIRNQPERDFYDFIHENAIKAVLEMLERFQLDSPEQKIVDAFDNLPGDDEN